MKYKKAVDFPKIGDIVKDYRGLEYVVAEPFKGGPELGDLVTCYEKGIFCYVGACYRMPAVYCREAILLRVYTDSLKPINGKYVMVGFWGTQPVEQLLEKKKKECDRMLDMLSNEFDIK